MSTLVPALNVLSTTLPDSTFFSVVRTKAPPLPGLTCWNSTTFQSTPSRSSVMPFFRSLVVATAGQRSNAAVALRSDDEQLIRRLRQDLTTLDADGDGVLDPHATA